MGEGILGPRAQCAKVQGDGPQVGGDVEHVGAGREMRGEVPALGVDG